MSSGSIASKLYTKLRGLTLSVVSLVNVQGLVLSQTPCSAVYSILKSANLYETYSFLLCSTFPNGGAWFLSKGKSS